MKKFIFVLFTQAVFWGVVYTFLYILFAEGKKLAMKYY